MNLRNLPHLSVKLFFLPRANPGKLVALGLGLGAVAGAAVASFLMNARAKPTATPVVELDERPHIDDEKDEAPPRPVPPWSNGIAASG